MTAVKKKCRNCRINSIVDTIFIESQCVTRRFPDGFIECQMGPEDAEPCLKRQNILVRVLSSDDRFRSMNMNSLLAPISTICVCSIFMGCSQESLIFYPEILPPDYPFAFSEPFEEVTVPVEAATLNALLFKAPNAKGVILYFHGNAGSLRTWGDVAGDFTSRGYDILIPDYRGFGKSTGNISNEKQLLRRRSGRLSHVDENLAGKPDHRVRKIDRNGRCDLRCPIPETPDAHSGVALPEPRRSGIPSLPFPAPTDHLDVPEISAEKRPPDRRGCLSRLSFPRHKGRHHPFRSQRPDWRR